MKYKTKMKFKRKKKHYNNQRKEYIKRLKWGTNKNLNISEQNPISQDPKDIKLGI